MTNLCFTNLSTFLGTLSESVFS